MSIFDRYYNYIKQFNNDEILHEEAQKFIEKYINCLETNPGRFVESIPSHLINDVLNILNEAGIKDEGLNILLNDRIRLREIYGE